MIFHKSEMLEGMFCGWDWRKSRETTDEILQQYYPEQADASLLTAKEVIEEIKESKVWELFVSVMNELKTEKLFKSSVHGQWHIERVAVLSCWLALKQGLDREMLTWCIEIAKYHDIGRKDDSEDTLHGRYGAEKIPKVCGQYPEEVQMLMAAVVEAHSLRDDDALHVFSKYSGLSQKWLERYKCLLAIVKDADALDRFRLTDHSLNLQYLRWEGSHCLIRAACEMVHMKQQKQKLALVACGNKSDYLWELLHREPKSRENLHVQYIVDGDANKWGFRRMPGGEKELEVISVGRAIRLYQEKEIDLFLIPSLLEDFDENIFRHLVKLGIPEAVILHAPELIFREEAEDGEKLKRITLFQERRELQTVEIHGAEHCNLNCKNCSMFCGLVKEPKFPDFEETKKGLLELKKYVDHIKKFRVIGGEPLLNPKLHWYLDLVRELFPYTDIRLITNGVLVQKMSEELMESVRKNQVTFIVTGYISLMQEHEKIHNFLKANHIKHEISDLITEFQKIYDYRGQSDPVSAFRACHWKKGCATLYNGRLSPCFVPFVLPYLSEAFQLDIPESGIMDLYAPNMSTRKIHQFFDTPFDMCRYCTEKRRFAPWERADQDSKTRIEDWSV